MSSGPSQLNSEKVPVEAEMKEVVEARPEPVEEPESKRQKTEEAKEQADPNDRLKMLEDIVSQIPDFELKKNIYGLTSNLMSEIMEKEKLCRNKDEEISTLSKLKEANEASTESNARSTAAVIAELLQLYNPNYVKNDSLSNEFVKTMSENPQVYEFLRPIEVCASRIKAERSRIDDAKKMEELDAYRKKCEALQNQLGVYNRMGGHVSEKKMEENWKPVQEPMPMAVAPTVTVSASAGNARKQDDIPEFLRRNLGTYNNGSYGTDRVLPSDFARPIIAKNQ